MGSKCNETAGRNVVTENASKVRIGLYMISVFGLLAILVYTRSKAGRRH